MRIAIVGTGIAGLGAAYALSRGHDVVLYERDDEPGGHANTIEVRTSGRTLALDTGFLVYNEPSYPRLTALFRELGVRTKDSDMSFSVSCSSCGCEYSSRRPLAQPANAVRPWFARLLVDVARFLRSARRILDDPRYQRSTLAEYLDAEGYSGAFRDHYLVPLTAAIWSAPPGLALELPATYAVRFFDNHGMLGFRRHRWKTVAGGSREYVRALLERIRGSLRRRSPVVELRRAPDAVWIRTRDADPERFDGAVVATHADEALRLLADPSDDERRLLGAFPYTRNEAVLHTDERLLPATPATRSSWNFAIADCRTPAPLATVTYSLNRLQRLDEPEQYCVTLNRSHAIRPERVLERIVYDHPRFTLESVDAQRRLPELNGVRRTAFAGAYHGFGFHEDGLVSGLAAASALGGAL